LIVDILLGVWLIILSLFLFRGVITWWESYTLIEIELISIDHFFIIDWKVILNMLYIFEIFIFISIYLGRWW
jgi:hypothetical protein